MLLSACLKGIFIKYKVWKIGYPNGLFKNSISGSILKMAEYPAQQPYFYPMHRSAAIL